jgi:FG-GAP-like repeat
VGHLKRERFLAAIEPWHGHQVVVYRKGQDQWKRNVIDESLVDGHSILTVDLDSSGRDEIVAGMRGDGHKVYIYRCRDLQGEAWQRAVLDDGGMAAASCVASDLNGDGKVDIVCVGSATHNLKWYENVR